MKIVIEYNSISFKTEISSDNQSVSNNLDQTILGIKDSGKRITYWFEDFISSVKNEINGEDFTLEINACDEYESDIISKILTGDKTCKIHPVIQTISNGEIEVIYKKIDDFFLFASKSEDSIVLEAYKPHKATIENLKSTKIEIPVIATMSSGKSTLLNAILGQDILPSLNEATTATTCEVKINNNYSSFEGKVINKETNDTLFSQPNITLDFAKEYNSQANNNNTISILLEGPISNFDTKSFDISFIDTPGPNNSQNYSHSKRTYTYFKDHQNLPIILYVLNATQLGINDDKNTLEELSKVFEKNKEVLGRVIFVINKIDQFDIEKESIKKCCENVEVYLGKSGINKPIIFPLSANYARLSQIGQLSRNDKHELDNYRNKFRPVHEDGYLGYSLIDNCSLSAFKKELLLNNVSKSDKDADLIYSGLAALKLYIEDYVSNQHLRLKYSKLNEVYEKSIAEIKSRIEFENKLVTTKDDEEKEANKKKFLLNIEEQDKKMKLVKNSLSELKFDKKFIDDQKKSIDNNNLHFQNESKKLESASPENAKFFVKRIGDFIDNVKISISTTITAQMNEQLEKHLHNMKKVATEGYRHDTESYELEYLNSNLNNLIQSVSLNDLTGFSEKGTIEKKRTIRKGWWIFSWDGEEVYDEEVEFINFSLFYLNLVSPRLFNLSKILKDFSSKVENEFMNLQSHFISKIDVFYDHAVKNIKHDFITKSEIGADQKATKIQYLNNLLIRINGFH
jgi:hypothetical protein